MEGDAELACRQRWDGRALSTSTKKIQTSWSRRANGGTAASGHFRSGHARALVNSIPTLIAHLHTLTTPRSADGIVKTSIERLIEYIEQLP